LFTWKQGQVRPDKYTIESYTKLISIGSGPHESVFNDSLWGDQAKRLLLRLRSPRFSLGPHVVCLVGNVVSQLHLQCRTEHLAV
jgi:hypothetical protein